MTHPGAPLARRVAIAAAACASLCLVGCAGSAGIPQAPAPVAMGSTGAAGPGPQPAHAAGGQMLTPQAAMVQVSPGSTRAEVAASLGPAVAVQFDSGYEVWVYRWPGADETARAATELVLLFEPGGRLAKLRLRPGL